MSEGRTSWVDRATEVVGLIAASIASLSWFVGDVPRVVRLGLAALAGTILIFVRIRRPVGWRLLYSSAPVVVLLVVTLVPVSRSWLLEEEAEPEIAARGPSLAIEDVRPSWDTGREPSAAERFRISIVVRNRAHEPVVVNRTLLGYHQGGGAVGGGGDDIWLQDEILGLHKSATEELLEIRQTEGANDDFAVPVVAFAKWYVAGVWDQVIELRPQAAIPANSVRTVRVTMPLQLRLAAIKTQQGGDTEIQRPRSRTTDFFVRFDDPAFEAFPRLLTVTVNTADGGCATHTTLLEPGKGESAKPRSTAFLDRSVRFEELCDWSPPPPPA